MDILKKFINNPGFEHLAENIIGFMDIDKAMEIMTCDELSEGERKFFKKAFQKSILKEFQEICQNQDCFEVFPTWKLKKFFNHPEFGHLAEKIIGFLDIDKAMEIMIESDDLSESERKFFKKTLKKSMLKETKEICEKHEFFKIFPWWKNHLEKLKNRGTLESFNDLYDILVLLQELPEWIIVLLQELPEWCMDKKKMILVIIWLNTGDAPPVKIIDFLKVIIKFSDDEDRLVLSLLTNGYWSDFESEDTD